MLLTNEYRALPRMMVDLETLGIKPSALICSIGVVIFDLYGNIHHTQEWKLNLNFQLDRSTDIGTILFWDNQPNPIPRGTAQLHEVLQELGNMYQNVWECKEIWANGINFDIVILEHAYRAYRLPIPWSFREARDYRTVLKMIPVISDSITNLNPHSALSDATYQVKLLNEALKN